MRGPLPLSIRMPPSARLDIVIDPKNGIPAQGITTPPPWMMRYILQEDIAGKSVIDMGTGTGILAILASMRGASAVAAVEIDRPAYENALENAVINKNGDKYNPWRRLGTSRDLSRPIICSPT